MVNYGDLSKMWSKMTDTDKLLCARLTGWQVADFYELICSRFNLSKSVAKKMLTSLERDGHVKIVWRSPKGARFFIKRGSIHD